MTALEALEKFGWLGVIIIWGLDKFFPRLWTFLTDKLFPLRAQERAQKLEQEEEAAKAKREAEATLMKAKIERELREEEHRRKIEERMVTAQEEISKNIQQMTLAITVNNERLGGVDTKLDQLDNFTRDAVGTMRVSVEKLHKRESQPKIPKIKQSRKKP